MKNKGILVVILLILCLGVFVTTNTRRLLSTGAGQETAPETYRSSMLPEFKEESSQGAPGGGSEVGPARARAYAAEASAAQDALLAEGDHTAAIYEAGAQIDEAENPVVEAAPIAEESTALPAPASRMAQADGSALIAESSMPVVISPLTGSKESSEGAGASINKHMDYEKKFQDLDAQIKNMKASEVEPNTDSYKNMADYEYRQWDSELNAIYQDIIKNMSTDEVDALRTEEKEWIKQRDGAAHKAISKYSGGTIESIEFTASLAASTRTRAYELLNNYGGYLDAGNTE